MPRRSTKGQPLNFNRRHSLRDPTPPRTFELHTSIPMVTRRQLMELMDLSGTTVASVIAQAVAAHHAQAIADLEPAE